MTTEDDFQKMLDKNPEDDQTRLIFADWLQDRDDPRADGYRALAATSRRPDLIASDFHYWNRYQKRKREDWLPSRWYNTQLPSAWFNLLDSVVFGLIKTDNFAPLYRATVKPLSRRQCEDGAAIAFSKLPNDLKQKYMKGIFDEKHPR